MPLYVRPTVTKDGFEFRIYDYEEVTKEGRRFLLDFWNSKVRYSLNFYDPTNEIVWKCHKCKSEFHVETIPENCSKCGEKFWGKSNKHFPVADEISDRLKFGLRKTLKIKIGQKSTDFYLEVMGKQVLFEGSEPDFKVVS